MPDKADVHIDAALSDVSIRRRNEEYVGERLFPAMSVSKDTDKYFVYGTEQFRLENDIRAPGTRAKKVDWTVSTDSYSLEEHALEKAIADEERDNADPPLSIEIDSVEFLTDLIQLRLENSIATDATTSGNYAAAHTAALSGGQQWSDYTNSDPLEDIRKARVQIHGAIAKKANVLVFGFQVYEILKNHPKILARMSHNERGLVTKQLLAELFEVEEVLVGSALKDTAKEGQTASLSYVWGKNVVLAYRPPRMGKKVIALGGTFRKQGMRQTETWRETQVKSDYIRVTDKYDSKIISNVAGYLYRTVVA